MSAPSYDLAWLEKNAFFSCQFQGCAESVSYASDMLKLWNGEPVCEGCYDYVEKADIVRGKHSGEMEDEPLLWDDLADFDPFVEVKAAIALVIKATRRPT